MDENAASEYLYTDRTLDELQKSEVLAPAMKYVRDDQGSWARFQSNI